jgi:excinuclease ABC subunit C
MTPEYVRSLPQLPGIYVFKDKNNGILYVGKAKKLKNRVISYFRKQNDDWKVQELIKEHAIIEHILTKNEIEALLLEAQLIKTYKPKYNVLLKNGNPFVYMMISSQELPQLKLTRNKKEKGTYFGPFLYKQKARSVFEYLMRTLRLQICKSSIEQGCLDYHMDLCSGSCLATFNSDDYKTRMIIAQRLLEGDYKGCKEFLMAQIKEYNLRMEFEKSKNLSKYLGDLEIIFETLKTGFTETKYAKDITVITAPLTYKVEKPQQALAELKKVLQLERTPATIDCFDISHFQSSYLVGSCIRFKHGIPDKQNFRRFKIKSLKEQNDYAALQEIVSRRYREISEAPDIVLIDGGKGQLSAVQELFPNLLCVSLAKKEEILFTPLHPKGIPLDRKSPLGQLLMCLRDYAHHFAVSYHKVLRSKNFNS